jgi:glycosyltransferase involved in cell wall biosynthesis
MKILLLGNYLHDEQESMQRFSGLMAQGLANAGHEVRTTRPRDVVGRLHPSGRGFGKWLGYVDKFAIFPSDLKSEIRWADVVHICDHSNSYYTQHLNSIPHVVSCHDLLGVRSARGEISQNQTRWTGRKLQAMIVKGLMNAQHVACVSEATRKDLLRVTALQELRVSRVYNSLNYPYSRMEKQEAATRLRTQSVDPERPYFLHVGGNQWYKNRSGVLRIFDAFRKQNPGSQFRLVMVGKPWTDEMRTYVSQNELRDSVLQLTGIDEEDLRALYSLASLLLFPSLDEGFGWPILEAQACGCPVLTTNRAPMNEVGGNAAVYVEPENYDLVAAAVQQVLQRVPELRESGLQNVERFSLKSMIDGYTSLYETVRQEARRRFN